MQYAASGYATQIVVATQMPYEISRFLTDPNHWGFKVTDIPDAMKDVAASILNNGSVGDRKEGDGVALYSTAYPLNITDEMIAAGLEAFQSSISRCEWKVDTLPTDMLRSIYTAMHHAEPVLLPDISEDALETVEVELPDSMFEGLARLIARMHGSAMTYKPPGELMQTVASQKGFGHWGHSADDYAEAHWRQYVQAARAAVQFLNCHGEDAGTEF